MGKGGKGEKGGDGRHRVSRKAGKVQCVRGRIGQQGKCNEKERQGWV